MTNATLIALARLEAQKQRTLDCAKLVNAFNNPDARGLFLEDCRIHLELTYQEFAYVLGLHTDKRLIDWISGEHVADGSALILANAYCGGMRTHDWPIGEATEASRSRFRSFMTPQEIAAFAAQRVPYRKFAKQRAEGIKSPI